MALSVGNLLDTGCEKADLMRFFKRVPNLAIHHSVGTCLRHVSMQTAMYQRLGNMPKACPYAMAQFVPSPIVADINRKPKQTKRTVPLVCKFNAIFLHLFNPLKIHFHRIKINNKNR